MVASAIIAAALIQKSGLSAFYLTSGQINPTAIARVNLLVEALNGGYEE